MELTDKVKKGLIVGAMGIAALTNVGCNAAMQNYVKATVFDETVRYNTRSVLGYNDSNSSGESYSQNSRAIAQRNFKRYGRTDLDENPIKVIEPTSMKRKYSGE